MLEAVRRLAGIGPEIGQAVRTSSAAGSYTMLFLRERQRGSREMMVVDTDLNQTCAEFRIERRLFGQARTDGLALAYPKHTDLPH